MGLGVLTYHYGDFIMGNPLVDAARSEHGARVGGNSFDTVSTTSSDHATHQNQLG